MQFFQSMKIHVNSVKNLARPGETFSKSLKFHVKCVLKTEKSSFDEKFPSFTFNIYLYTSNTVHICID